MMRKKKATSRNEGKDEVVEVKEDEEAEIQVTTPSSSSSSSSLLPVPAPPVPNERMISHKNFIPEENDEVERATVEKYRRINEKTVVSMIIYRINVWKKMHGKNKAVDNPEDEILQNKYSGCLDFEVNHNIACPMYVMSRTYLPIRGDILRGGPVRTHTPQPQWIRCFHKTVSCSHCEITAPNYADDCIWIEDINENGGTRTFVNGKRISKGKKYMLVDGDIIALGASQDSVEQWSDLKGKRGFVFKVKSLKRCGELGNQNSRVADEDYSGSTFLALNNTIILGEILRFLSHKELKSARLVNKFWKHEVDMKIFSRSVVKLESPLCHYRPPKNWESDFIFTLSMIEKYNLPNWKITFAVFRKHEEFYVKILKLLKDKGPFVRDLKLGISYESEEDGDRFISILRCLPNLKTLQLDLKIFASTFEDHVLLQSIPAINPPENFPSVKNFCLGEVIVYLKRDDLHFENDILVQAAKLFPNIQKITSKGDLGLALRPISVHKLWATGLTEIFGEGSMKSLLFDIIQSSQKLKKLELHSIPAFRNLAEVTSFENMLSKHADTLEHLVLGFERNYGSETDMQQPILMRLPTFPKLRTLEIVARYQKDFKFQIMFPSSSSGSICYEKDLPQIQTLRLLASSLTFLAGRRKYTGVSATFNTEAVLDIFVPQDSLTVSRTMRCVEFGLEGKKRRKLYQWFSDFVERFRRMFPHVHHPHLEENTKEEEESSENSESSDEEEQGPTPPPSPPRRMRTRSTLS